MRHIPLVALLVAGCAAQPYNPWDDPDLVSRAASVVQAGDEGRALGLAARQWTDTHPGAALPPWLMPPQATPVSCDSYWLAGGGWSTGCW